MTIIAKGIVGKLTGRSANGDWGGGVKGSVGGACICAVLSRVNFPNSSANGNAFLA